MSIVIAEFTGDLSLALDTAPARASPAPSDSLDITAELAEPTQTVVEPLDQRHLSSMITGPPAASVTSVDQSQAGLRLDLYKSSTAKGTDLPR